MLPKSLETINSYPGHFLALEDELLVEIHRIFRRGAFFSETSYADYWWSIIILV